jgi:hypothetical protein
MRVSGWFILWLLVGAALWWAFIQVFYFLRAVVVLFLMAHGGHHGRFFGL